MIAEMIVGFVGVWVTLFIIGAMIYGLKGDAEETKIQRQDKR